MKFKAKASIAIKLYYYTAREQPELATKKFAECANPIFFVKKLLPYQRYFQENYRLLLYNPPPLKT